MKLHLSSGSKFLLRKPPHLIGKLRRARVCLTAPFKSLEHMGEVLDKTVTSPEFQSLVENANEFSTLEAASIMVPI